MHVSRLHTLTVARPEQKIHYNHGGPCVQHQCDVQSNGPGCVPSAIPADGASGDGCQAISWDCDTVFRYAQIFDHVRPHRLAGRLHMLSTLHCTPALVIRLPWPSMRSRTPSDHGLNTALIQSVPVPLLLLQEGHCSPVGTQSPRPLAISCMPASARWPSKSARALWPTLHRSALPFAPTKCWWATSVWGVPSPTWVCMRGHSGVQ